jgi:hypothetical protein
VNSGITDVSRQYLLASRRKLKNTGPEITTVGPLPKALKEQYPRLVKNYYRFNPVINVVPAGDRHFRENSSIGDTTLI